MTKLKLRQNENKVIERHCWDLSTNSHLENATIPAHLSDTVYQWRPLSPNSHRLNAISVIKLAVVSLRSGRSVFSFRLISEETEVRLQASNAFWKQ